MSSISQFLFPISLLVYRLFIKVCFQGAKLIRHTYRFVNKIGVDPSTGLLTSKPPPINHYNAINLERALAYEPPPERYQDHIDYLSHFLDCAGENKLSDDHVNLVKQVSTGFSLNFFLLRDFCTNLSHDSFLEGGM